MEDNFSLEGTPLPSWWQQFKSWQQCVSSWQQFKSWWTWKKAGLCLLAALVLIGGSVAVGVTVKNNKDAAKQQQQQSTTTITRGQIQREAYKIPKESSPLSSTSYQDLFAEPVGEGMPERWPGANTKAIFVGYHPDLVFVDYVVTQPTAESFYICYVDSYDGDTLTRVNGCRNAPLSGNFGTFVADNAPIIYFNLVDNVVASESAILVPTHKDENGAQKYAQITLPNNNGYENERITGVSEAFTVTGDAAPAWHTNNVVVTTTHDAYIVGYPLKGGENTFIFRRFTSNDGAAYCYAAWVGNMGLDVAVLYKDKDTETNKVYFQISKLLANGGVLNQDMYDLELQDMAPQETPAEERGNYDAATVMHNANIVANADETRWLVTLGTNYKLIELSEDGGKSLSVVLSSYGAYAAVASQPILFTKAAFVQPVFKLPNSDALFDAGIIAVATSNDVMFFDKNHKWIDTAKYENGKTITETVVVHMHADIKLSDVVLDFATKKDYMDRTPAVTVYTPTTRHVVPMPPKVLLRYMGIETAQYNFKMRDGIAVPLTAEVTFQEAFVFGVYVPPAAGAAAANGQSLFCVMTQMGQLVECTEIATSAKPVTPVAFHTDADGTHFFVAFDNNQFAYGLFKDFATKLQDLLEFDIADGDDAIVTGAGMFSTDGTQGVEAMVSTTKGVYEISFPDGSLSTVDIGLPPQEWYAITNPGNDETNGCSPGMQVALADETIIILATGLPQIKVPNLKRQATGQTTAAAASIQCKNNVVLATIDNSWVVVDLTNVANQQLELSATVEDSRVVATFVDHPDADTEIVAIATKTHIKTVEDTGTYTRAKHLDSDSDDDDDEVINMVYDADENAFVLARSKSGMQTVPLLWHRNS